MRTKLFSLLLISSFLIGSVPAHAQALEPVTPDAPVEEAQPEPTVEATDATVPEEAPATSSPVDEAPAEAPVVDETDVERVEELATEPPAFQAAEALEGPPPFMDVTGSITLPNGCIVTDASGKAHVLPQATTTEYLAACALVEAVEGELIDGFAVSDTPYGLYLTTVDGIAAGTDEYWAINVNGAEAMCGVGCLEVKAGDKVEFVLTNFKTMQQSHRLTLDVTLEDAHDNVIVPSTCTVTDSAGTTHTISGGKFLTICALEAAADEEYLSGYSVDTTQYGLYLTTLNGIKAGGDEYWAIWVNGKEAMCGVGCLEVKAGDEIEFVLTNFMTMTTSSTVDLRVIKLLTIATPPPGGGDGDNGGGSGSGPAPLAFDIDLAYDFLEKGQNKDGSWDSELVTDWSAFALGISGAPQGMKSDLISYLKREEPDFESVRDYERHALALMALGLNPYTDGPSDYIAPIVKSFDGRQIDDSSLMNDDVFGLLVLLHAGYSDGDEMIRDIVEFIVDQQNGNGSWEESVDMTAATIQILSEVRKLPGVAAAIADAEGYLRGEQKEDGGFENPFATTWALQAIAALNDDPEDWAKGEHTPLTYLEDLQEEDGGLTTTPDDYGTRAWAIAYAIPAVKGLTWDDVLRDFKKPSDTDTGNGSSEGATDGDTATTTATTTDELIAPAPDMVFVDPPMLDEIVMDAPVEAMAQVMATVAATPRTEPVARANTVAEEGVAPAAEDAEGIVAEEPRAQNQLTASVAESGAWERIAAFFAGLWSFLKGLFS